MSNQRWTKWGIKLTWEVFRHCRWKDGKADQAPFCYRMLRANVKIARYGSSYGINADSTGALSTPSAIEVCGERDVPDENGLDGKGSSR